MKIRVRTVLEQSIRERLDGWQAKVFSMMGRVTLVWLVFN